MLQLDRPMRHGDYVWNDVNQNGSQDEPPSRGINGVTVRLYKCDAPNVVIATTVTSNGGLYSFGDLPPGTYHVEFETPNGYVQTTVDVGARYATRWGAQPVVLRATVTNLSNRAYFDSIWGAGRVNVGAPRAVRRVGCDLRGDARSVPRGSARGS